MTKSKVTSFLLCNLVHLFGLQIYWDLKYVISESICLSITRWRHDMETVSALLALCGEEYMMMSSNGNIFRVAGHLCGELWCFFDLRVNKRLSKQSWGWWFETLSRPWWRHYDAHCSPMESSYKRPVMQSFHDFFVCGIWINCWTNSQITVDLRPHDPHVKLLSMNGEVSLPSQQELGRWYPGRQWRRPRGHRWAEARTEMTEIIFQISKLTK